jgi:hypothetical protein
MFDKEFQRLWQPQNVIVDNINGSGDEQLEQVQIKRDNLISKIFFYGFII